MRVTGTLVSTTALILLGSLPRLAEAQCVVGYTDFSVNTAQGTVDAWAFIQDYFNTEYCSPGGYQWGYFEHHYFPNVTIESPTQNSAYGEDYQVMPYGGGSGYAFTSLSIEGDPGWFHIAWCLFLACTGLGGYIENSCDDEDIYVPPIPIVVNLTFDDGPTSDAVEDYSRRVIATLAANSVQPLAPATFFVQTHVSNRGGNPGGITTMEMALDAEHAIQIHTGSDEDHALHTVRMGELPYPPWGGSNGLESDLIRAKDRIANELDDGSVPELVRPPEGVYNSAVLNTYADPDVNLECVYWNVDSGDTAPAPVTVESMKTHLEDDISTALSAGQRQLVVLFHDVKSITSDNLGEYLQTIKSAIEGAGYSLVFLPLPEQAFLCD